MAYDTADARKVAEEIKEHFGLYRGERAKVQLLDVIIAYTERVRQERKLIAYQQETNLHDMIQGPCKCGATHTVEETVHNIKARAEAAEENLAALEVRCFEGFPSVSDGIFDAFRTAKAELDFWKAEAKEWESKLAAMIHEGDAEASRIRAALNLPEDGRSLEEQVIEYGKSNKEI